MATIDPYDLFPEFTLRSHIMTRQEWCKKHGVVTPAVYKGEVYPDYGVSKDGLTIWSFKRNTPTILSIFYNIRDENTDSAARSDQKRNSNCSHYPIVGLRKDGLSKTRYVHVLVKDTLDGKSWKKTPPMTAPYGKKQELLDWWKNTPDWIKEEYRKDGYQVNHIDNNPNNHCIENLEYVTPSQNINHTQEYNSVRRQQLNG